MATIFKYNNMVYQCMSLDKKLNRLRINKEDIDILFEGDISQSDLEKKYLEFTKEKRKEVITSNATDLYYFLNKETGESIVSIYPELDSYIKNANDYERTTKENLERNWNKTRQLY